MWKKFILFIFLLIAVPVFSQSDKEIQSYREKFFIYHKIGADSALMYVDRILLSKNDADLAFAYTAKRYLLTITGKEKEARACLLKINHYLKKVQETEENYTTLSNIYNILGNTDMANQLPDEALKNFIKADFFAEKNNDIKQHIKIKGNIAFVKLTIGQTDDAIVENREVLNLLKKNKSLYPQENFEIIYNTVFSNMGHLYSDKYITDPQKNKKYGDSALYNFNELLRTTKDKKLLAKTYLKLGTLSNKKKEYFKASEYYLKSLDMYRTLKLKDETLNLKYNLGVNFYEHNDYMESKRNFLEMSHLMEKDSMVNTDYIFAQDYLARIYLKEGKTDSVEFYNKKFIELYKENSELEKKKMGEIYREINSKNLNDEISKSSSTLRNRLFLIIALIALIGCITGYLLFQIRKKKNIERSLDELMLQVKDYSLASRPTKNSFTISDEKEAEIMGKLIELEEKKLYLKNEYNQAFVAKKLNTNTSYLSQTINKYMKKSFSEYTNELRINYILKELSEDKKLRNYTTQALADIVGYKNGISFARTFKEKTGVTPFQYIEKLNKDL
ncbi:helix-turn-helix domain-containing protein [Chryseobacterium pennipullorum]|uniref:HTH araC/xylS-type domain-containing protein n=1 Tax=Chryseobacterium pennipullorum TaxID=2258963 RepID=A0A3D9B147_9FLAO|nr:helix-turn-helix domain-containing protein [Chryseobacterium pennipullorum]REC47249.1 hypothetical protein DRF67_11550 [Chryseobacterium pennipullorum]